MAHFASPEMVAVAWAKQVAGVDPTKVATTLPGDAGTWSSTGFVQVTVVGGFSDVDVPVYTPVIAFDCWANAANSSKAPWGKAGALAAAIQWATYRHAPFTVDMPGDFHPARLLSVYTLDVPRRIPADSQGYARVQLTVQMAWTVTP